MKLYEVAVAAPLFDSLTYSQPVGVTDSLPIGIRVLVPLGNRLVTGYLLGPAAGDADNSTFQVKAIVDLLDPDPLFPEELIPFFRWIADYYHHPLGEVIRTGLPGGLIVRSGREVVLTDSGRQQLPDALSAVKKQAAWMQRLLDKGRLLPGTVNTIWRKPAMQRLLKKWQQEGWLEIQEVIVEPKVKAKTRTMVNLSLTLQERLAGYQTKNPEQLPQVVDGLKKSEHKTLELFFKHCDGRTAMPRPELTRRYSGAGKALHGLVDRGLVTLEEQRCYRDPFGCVPPFFARPETLTQEQKIVISDLIAAVDRKKFQPYLLFGVTGCGKTEVYLRATERCLDLDKTVLVLVPEIALASQVEAHFYSRFGNTLAVLHSGLTAGERFDQWQRILQKKACIVIGARSAVFAPLADLGLVIVDEEHEPAYKQDDGLRYNGRDIAVLRARFADCPVILGSATPSVTSFHHTTSGKYQLLTMRRRVNDQPMPEVEIVDLGSKKRDRPDLFFSDQLTAALHENMEKRLQSLLFVNRRGYASFMLCRDCGHIIECRHCKVSLAHHRHSNRLICHYCGYSISPNITCPACRSNSVVGLGIGSERIEAEVRQLIPHARVARLDSDTTTDRQKYMAKTAKNIWPFFSRCATMRWIS
ncbi:MAG: primosomal protein N' [Deltaproteobacteria bacterium]|nr:primosomal protein N' [Deltaproteobacteria bacterium]